MRKIVAVSAIVGVCCGAALVQGSPQGGNQMVKPEHFAILTWSTISPDKALLESIRDCGFNLAGFCTPDALDLVRDVGLKCFVYDPSTSVGDEAAGFDDAEIAKRVQALVKRVGNDSAVFGYYLRDEPGAGVFPGLGRWAAAFATAAPGALAYINLYPNYASPEQLGAPTYEDYLARYVADVKPRFISYDNYSLMDDGTLRDGYFQNLEAVRKASLSAGIPFWNIVLSNSHFHYAEPTPGGLRFEAYTTLAYGARGISYFTYTAPAVGNYRLAPIDQFGHKTPTWDMLRNVNLQIGKLVPTYVQMKSINVFHVGDVPKGCSGIASSKLLSRVEGGNFVVGEFSGPGARVSVIVVNKDLHRSASFSVAFKEPGPVMMVNPYTGREQPFAGENGWLAPGQGTLLILGK